MDQNIYEEQEEQQQYIDMCRGCKTTECNEQHDAYGITTGYWCDECYNSSKYPYRKDRYDYEGNGERLDDDY